jgi:hypothetical protein
MRIMRYTVAILVMVYLSMAGVFAFAANDIDSHRSCNFCGMDRKAYGYSRMLIRYEDGTEVGTCSLRCAVIELDAVPGRPIRALLVADRDSRTLVNAEQAFWVMGGSRCIYRKVRRQDRDVARNPRRVTERGRSSAALTGRSAALVARIV